VRYLVITYTLFIKICGGLESIVILEFLTKGQKIKKKLKVRKETSISDEDLLYSFVDFLQHVFAKYNNFKSIFN